MRGNNEKRRERILHAPLYKVLWTISLPLIINNFIQTLYNLIDGVWLGQLGKVEFAATAFVWPIIFLFVSLGFGIGIAGVSILSRLIGSNRMRDAKDYVNHLLVIALGVSIVFSLLGYFMTPWLIYAMGAEGDLAIYSIEYLKINFMGYSFVVLFFVFKSIMDAQGDTKSTTWASGISVLVNMVLDPYFIFEEIPWVGMKGLGLGIRGAGYATIFSQAMMMVLGLLITIKKSPELRFDFSHWKMQKNKAKKIFQIGLPSALGQSGSAVGFLIMNVFITSYGTNVLAAFSMVNRITGLLTQPSMGFGAALTSVAGQNMGAGNISRVKEAYRKSMMMSLVFSLVGVFFLFLFRYPIIGFFIKDKSGEVLREAMPYLYYSLLIVPLMGMFNVNLGIFNGASATSYAMAMTVGRLWVLRIPMVLFFKYFTHLGSRGIWISMLWSNLLTVVYGIILYLRGRWLEKKI